MFPNYKTRKTRKENTMKPSYRQDNEHFKFHNENPKNSLSSGDCVIRAIGFATEDGWDNTFQGLAKVAFKKKDTLNATKVFTQYLRDIGWIKHPQPRKYNNTKYTVKEFTKLHKKGTYIVSVANHITVVKDGMIYDTWDCSHKCVGNYWTK